MAGNAWLRLVLAVASLVGATACASKPPTIGDVLARLPAARAEEPARVEERIMRMTLERAVAAGQVPPERPLVLLRSPFGSARVLPARGDTRFVLLSFDEIAQLAARHGTFLYIYLRLENREGSRKPSIDQKGIEPDQTSARVTMFIFPAAPPPPEGYEQELRSHDGQTYAYAKRGGDWVFQSSTPFGDPPDEAE